MFKLSHLAVLLTIAVTVYSDDINPYRDCGYHDVTNVEIVGCPRAATRCTLDRGGEKILNITYDSVSPNVTYDMEAPCDRGSVIDHLSYHGTLPAPVTCTGVIVSKDDDTYNATFADGHQELIPLTDLTQIFIYINGNQFFPVCGTVSGGQCAGDLFWGNGILIADTQTGCRSETGVEELKVLFSDLEFIGKCSSRCNSAGTTFKYDPPINRNGFVQNE
ncbi:unnamed protein product [Oppiella nova]|uniref:Uncharacterized protein n=1 Tax=Oppiella nova TaxID=334625 RepID=A0A7R9M9T1_9ACAR|nr:unnamed protein product [Oppiella nova]CAG2173450.1 unnamed protein product [Oppiella nova]